MIRVRKEQATGVLEVVGSLLFGTDRAAKKVIEKAVDEIGDRRERHRSQRLREGSLDVEGVAVVEPATAPRDDDDDPDEDE